MSEPAHKVRVGIVGVGSMGASIAISAIRAGLNVTVFDVRQSAVDELVAIGAHGADSVADLSGQCDIISVVVVDNDQVRDVLVEILNGSTLPRVVVVQSSILPGTVAELTEAGAKKGVAVIDATVSGGSEKAQKGTLTLMVGGPEESVQYCQPFFEAIAENVFHIGAAGTGTVAKLVNDVLAMGGYALQLEAVELAAAYGISEDTFATFVSLSSGDSHYVRTWGRQDRLRRVHTFAGTPAMYTYLKKDLEEAVVAAAEHGLNLPLVSVAAGLLPSKLMARDQTLAGRGPAEDIPLCDICGQELAPPFRKYGVHPECRPFAE